MKELDEVRSELLLLRGEVQQLLQRLSEPRERRRLFEFQEAAELLGVAPKTVSRMVASGELLVTELRGKRLIHVDEIDRVSRPTPPKARERVQKAPRYDPDAESRKLRELRRR